VLVLDAGGVSRLAARNRRVAALIVALREQHLWPPVVPSAALIECLTGDPGRDAVANRFLKTCDIVETLPIPLARRAARLRALARRGSAVDALVVAVAEPTGVVLTGDVDDLSALASRAEDVTIERI
jgi:hypothetical protein